MAHTSLCRRRSRQRSGGRTAEVFRVLGDAYLLLPEPQYLAADAALQSAIDRKKVTVGGGKVPPTSVKPGELSRVSRRDRREMGQIYAQRAVARRGTG